MSFFYIWSTYEITHIKILTIDFQNLFKCMVGMNLKQYSMQYAQYLKLLNLWGIWLWDSFSRYSSWQRNLGASFFWFFPFLKSAFLIWESACGSHKEMKSNLHERKKRKKWAEWVTGGSRWVEEMGKKWGPNFLFSPILIAKLRTCFQVKMLE